MWNCFFQINNVVGLLLYSWFVLTSTSTKYNVEESMRAVEYYVYLWRFGDFIEEVLQCSVSLKFIYHYLISNNDATTFYIFITKYSSKREDNKIVFLFLFFFGGEGCVKKIHLRTFLYISKVIIFQDIFYGWFSIQIYF